MRRDRSAVVGLFVSLLFFAVMLGGCSSDSPAATSATPDAGPDPTRVTVAGGALEGDVVGGSVRFLKIPYAKPPKGALRWKAPQAADAWTGVRHETSFASPCPQPPSQQTMGSTDEDCLYLNVWRPKAATHKAPVLVWIHGGGFTTGSAADIVPLTKNFLWYNGQAFAENGAVLVTLNYRLGVFGFFAHQELSGEGSPLGNQGLLDQRAALEWVKSNIAAFGGDPGDVTIFGQSAGSGSVCMHVASPGSRGLFHRAISESGGCTTSGATDFNAINTQITTFAGDHGCPGATTLDCLRALPADQLVSSMYVDRTMGMAALKASFAFGPVVDGPGGFMPKPPKDQFAAGDVAKVPYMLGSTNDEARLYYISATVPQSEADYQSWLQTTYGTFASRVGALYPSSKFGGDYQLTVARIATDSNIVCGTLDTARHAAAAGLPGVYMYNFDIDWSISPTLFGACHTSEISHVFGTPYMVNAASAAVSVAMNHYWRAFAQTGNPNFTGAPGMWPAFGPDAQGVESRIQFDVSPGYETLKDFRKDECQLWADYAAAQP